MKTKTFDASSAKRLDNKVNKFLDANNIEVIDIKYSCGYAVQGAMIIYKEK